MPKYYIAINSEEDYIYLCNMFDRALAKIKSNASTFDLDQAEKIIRIHEDLHNNINPDNFNAKDLEQHDVSSQAKTRVSKNPKSSRSIKPPKMRVNLCEQHPYYGAVRAPQHSCEGCWEAYKSLNPNSYEKKKRDFKRKMSKEAQ